MTRDKQLLHVDLAEVLEKRRLDQALNVKEFAVLAGISYSAARAWVKQPGFPAICGVIFWQDFVQWRNTKTGLRGSSEAPVRDSIRECSNGSKSDMIFSGKAAEILAEA